MRWLYWIPSEEVAMKYILKEMTLKMRQRINYGQWFGDVRRETEGKVLVVEMRYVPGKR